MHGEAEKLVREHVRHVQSTAKGFHFSSSTTFSEDDLVSAGLEALVRCAQRYDASCCSDAAGDDAFWGYAYSRVRGAMQDAVRRWFHYDRVNDESRDPFLSMDFVYDEPEDAAGGGGEQTLHDVVGVESQPVFDLVDAWDAVARLPDQEREVVVRRVCGDLSAHEIGRDMGLSESLVWYISSQAQRHLDSPASCRVCGEVFPMVTHGNRRFCAACRRERIRARSRRWRQRRQRKVT